MLDGQRGGGGDEALSKFKEKNQEVEDDIIATLFHWPRS